MASKSEAWRNEPVTISSVACMRTAGQVNFYQIARHSGISESTVVRYYATGTSRKKDQIEAGAVAHKAETAARLARYGGDDKLSPAATASREAWAQAYREHKKRPISRGRLADIFDGLVWSKYPIGGLSAE
jgi:hypothetical protein